MSCVMYGQYKKYKRLVDRYVNYLNSIRPGFKIAYGPIGHNCSIERIEIYFEETIDCKTNTIGDYSYKYNESVYADSQKFNSLYSSHNMNSGKRGGRKNLYGDLVENVILEKVRGKLYYSNFSVDVASFSSMEEMDMKLTLMGF